MHHSCSRYGVASCFPSRGSSGSRGIQRVLPQYAIGEPIFPYLLVLSLCISKGHAQIVDESGRPVTPTIEGPVDNLHLSLDPCFVRRVALEACGMPPVHVEIRDVFSGRDPEIACLGHRLLRELTTAGLGGRVYAESLATLLALHLLRTYGAQPPRLCSHTGGLSPHKLRLVQEYIHAHLDQPLGLADLAALVQLSTPHFLRMFKQSMGQAPHQYILAQRMERAKAYLRTSRLCMTE